jgi:prepilin-type N-terminal cleavage/methylation domain-containing protein
VADPPVMKQEISIRNEISSVFAIFLFSRLREATRFRYSNQKAFSFIELLFALSIIGILTAIAVPQTNAWVDHYRLNGAARLVWGDLQSAKMTAIKSNQTITVTFNSTTSYNFSQAGSTIFSRNLIQEYPTITVVKSGGGNLTFEPTGLTQNATIIIQGLGNTKSVTTLWTGRILVT